MKTLVQIFANYQAIIGIVFALAAVALTVFDRLSRQRNKELIDTQDRLIATMQAERAEDVKRILVLEEQSVKHNETILKFEGANEVLRSLLTEKDEASVGYRLKAMESFEISAQTHTLTVEMVDLLRTLCEGLKKPAKKRARA